MSVFVNVVNLANVEYSVLILSVFYFVLIVNINIDTQITLFSLEIHLKN